MKIKHLMTKEVLTVGPYTPILSAVEILVYKRFNGIPVVDKDGLLVGLLTQHDMMLRGTDMHLPTLIHIMTDVQTYGRDKKFMSAEMRDITNMKTGDIMNPDPMTLSPEDPVDRALQIFAQRHDVNPIAVVDEGRKLVGVMSRYDMIKLFGERPDKEVELKAQEREVDKRVLSTLPKFQKKFVFVSRMRVALWLIVSLSFGLIGFLAAFLFMLRFV